MGRNALGQGFHKPDRRGVDQHADGIGDHVVGKDIAEIARREKCAPHPGFHRKPHALRRFLLMCINADPHRQNEILHENPIGRGKLLRRARRIAARGEQAHIEAFGFGLSRSGGNEIPHHLHRLAADLPGSAGCAAKCGAKAENVGLKQQQARNVGRFKPTGKAGKEPYPRHFSTKCASPAMSICCKSLPLALFAVSSMAPKKPASAKSGKSEKSGAVSAKNTAINLTFSDNPASAAIVASRLPPGKRPILRKSTPVSAMCFAAGSTISGSVGRLPSTALVWLRARKAAQPARMISGATAPKAPSFGFLKSITSAPPAKAISASSGSATLARNSVMGCGSFAASV